MGVAEGVPGSIRPDHNGRADYLGPSVNMAARLMDAGEGGRLGGRLGGREGGREGRVGGGRGRRVVTSVTAAQASVNCGPCDFQTFAV